MSIFPGLDYKPSPSPLECILPHERSAAEMIVFNQFREACGKYPPHVAGYNVLVRVYQRETEKEIRDKDGNLITSLVTRSARAQDADKYQSVVGLVIGLGPQAYKGNNFDGTPRFPEGYWCAIGDWVVIPRYEGQQFSYGDKARGQHTYIPLVILPDDKILCKVNDPEDVVATHVVSHEAS